MDKQETMKELTDAKQTFAPCWSNDYDRENFEDGVDFALEFIDKHLDEPEKPVIPQFIDTWIQGAKYNGFDLYEAMTDDEMSDKVVTWIVCNSETFAKAWFYGYEVEKEKLYTAKLKSTNEYLHYDKNYKKILHFRVPDDVVNQKEAYHFTEDDLIKYYAWENEAYDVKEVDE